MEWKILWNANNSANKFLNKMYILLYINWLSRLRLKARRDFNSTNVFHAKNSDALASILTCTAATRNFPPPWSRGIVPITPGRGLAIRAVLWQYLRDSFARQDLTNRQSFGGWTPRGFAAEPRPSSLSLSLWCISYVQRERKRLFLSLSLSFSLRRSISTLRT